jgi:hypothetical protein
LSSLPFEIEMAATMPHASMIRGFPDFGFIAGAGTPPPAQPDSPVSRE